MRSRRYLQTTRDVSRIILTILVAPLALSFVADLLKGKAPTFSQDQIWLVVILGLLYLALATLSFTTWLDRAIVAVSRRLRRHAFRRPHVLVLDGTLSSNHEIPARAVHSVYTAHEWASEMNGRQSSWKVQIAPLEIGHLRDYQVVLNPFGEVYPEADPGIVRV
jgi:hypothetical protein